MLSSAPPAAAFGTSEPSPIPSVSAGGYMSCGVQADQTAACWGENGVPSNDIAAVHPGGAATPPAGVRFLEVNAGYATACGVKTDQAIVCWGSGRFEKVQSVPAGQFKHVAPGTGYVCALRTDDTITCWGGDDRTIDPDLKVLRDVPSGQFTQLSVGARHACALRADGSIRCWGHNSNVAPFAQTDVPGGNDAPGLYTSMNAGNFTTCAVRLDGSPVCWGRNAFAQQTYPAGAKFSRLSTGFGHVCGVRSDGAVPAGTLTCWGRNSEGQSSPIPAGTYTHVTSGTFHTCAMPTGGGQARCWGNNMSGRVQPNMSSVPPPKAYVGVPYNATFTMNSSVLSGAGDKAGLSPAPTFSLVEGALPAGVTLSPSGAVSGTPTAPGSSTIKVAASNGLSPSDCSKVASAGDSMFCTPGDPTSLGTATRVFTFDVAADVPASGDLTGRLTSSADGASIAGATVGLTYGDSTPVGQTTTDGNGSYTFGGLRPDSYKLTATAFGFTSQAKPATVTSTQTTAVDFSLVPRLTRPQIVGVWSNHWQTVSDGVFVEWSEEFDMLQQVGAAYTVHASSDASCTGTPVATGRVSNWLGENPNTTTPRTPSRTRDIEMTGYESVTPGAAYNLRVEANTEFGKTTGQQNVLTCVPYVAQLRPMDRGAVTGKVTSAATGVPIAGATVAVKRTIRQLGSVAGQATTDASGNYQVTNLAPSNYFLGGYSSPYQVVVSAPGYSPATGTAPTTFSAGTSTVAPSTSTATLNAALVNNAPDAVDDASSTAEDTPLTVSAAAGVLANDTDAEGDALKAALAAGPSNGVVALNADGSFTYTPNANFNGADSFTYTATDSLGASDTATVAITVAAVNDAPVAGNDAYSTDEDTPLTVSPPGVLSNDSDIDGDGLAAAVATGTSNGAVVLNVDGTFTYTPNANFNGADSFTYTVSDGHGGSATGTVAIAVAAVNDAPVASNDAYSHFGSDTALVVTAAGVLGNDTDVEASPLTAAVSRGPSNGTLTLSPDGSFTYRPNEDFVGSDSFTYKASDGSATSNEATVTISVGAGCRGQRATLTGTSRDDRLNGTKGVDVIAGLGGNDLIVGQAGNDVICGGTGADTLNTGDGGDYADGGSGDDKVNGDDGNDTLLGGAGADTLNGDGGNDTLAGGTGTPDTCNGGAGTDSLAPDHGCEKITGLP